MTIQSNEIEAQLQEMTQRLDRLERLAFLGFQDARTVAEYAFQGFGQEPEDVKRLSWTSPSFHSLSDEEALKAGLALHELAALKMTIRHLRHQVRSDALSIIKDLVRNMSKKSVYSQKKTEKPAHAKAA